MNPLGLAGLDAPTILAYISAATLADEDGVLAMTPEDLTGIPFPGPLMDDAARLTLAQATNFLAAITRLASKRAANEARQRQIEDEERQARLVRQEPPVLRSVVPAPASDRPHYTFLKELIRSRTGPAGTIGNNDPVDRAQQLSHRNASTFREYQKIQDTETSAMSDACKQFLAGAPQDISQLDPYFAELIIRGHKHDVEALDLAWLQAKIFDTHALAVSRDSIAASIASNSDKLERVAREKTKQDVERESPAKKGAGKKGK